MSSGVIAKSYLIVRRVYGEENIRSVLDAALPIVHIPAFIQGNFPLVAARRQAGFKE
jgi:hypothetical protein